MMNQLERHLLNDFQRGFPLKPKPFDEIALRLKTDPRTVIETLKQLNSRGAVSRVGPVFRPNTVGSSTLAAMAVPPDRLDEIAELVNRYREVNHNYEREHQLNLWFVLTTQDQQSLDAVIADIEQRSGYRVLSLPLVREYHIDLGFEMQLDAGLSQQQGCLDEGGSVVTVGDQRHDHTDDEKLVEAIQLGLPLVDRPYHEVGAQIGMSEEAVIRQIGLMQAEGVIKRFGVVVRHHELGYRSNAMLVLDIPDAGVEAIGSHLSQIACVTLCYQRPRRLPDWPYNLFCMIHGKDREDVLRCIDDVVTELELIDIPRAVLFSKKRYKQRGAVYRSGNSERSKIS